HRPRPLPPDRRGPRGGPHAREPRRPLRLHRPAPPSTLSRSPRRTSLGDWPRVCFTRWRQEKNGGLGALEWPRRHATVAAGAQEEDLMGVSVRSASLQDGVAVLSLLEEVGYYPEPLSFAKTFRKTISDPHFLVRVAEADGRIVGMATLSLRYQLGL